MLFNSVEFGVFLPLILLLYGVMPNKQGRHVTLLIASYLFYAGWKPIFVLLLAFSTVLDFTVAKRMEAEERQGWRRFYLFLSLAGNLGVLFYFKYADWVLSEMGLIPPDPNRVNGFQIEGTIPPGLSFYTFQTLSYTIDLYRRKIKAERSLLRFALYVAFFPQLMAGPVLKATEFFPQLDRSGVPAQRDVIQGVELFAVGLFKKLVIADNLGIACDHVFEDVRGHTGPALAVGGLLFWGQVYCDFSGYSTMARGLAKMVGFDLPRNFHFPLLAGDPLTYRRSWHTTMSRWFRDYLFHPLGGSRVGPLRYAINIIIVWAAFGLWHGAAWPFVAWGVYNGILQATWRELLRRGLKIPEYRGKYVAGVLFNTMCVIPSGIIFRAATVSDGVFAVGKVWTFGMTGHGIELVPAAWLIGAGGLHILSYRYYQDEDVLNKVGWPVRMVLLAGISGLILLFSPETRPFIYFQF